jgi:hypothetical protein
MAKKEVTVVINGEEYVSKAAKEAEVGMTGFAGFMDRLKDKMVPVVDVTKLVELAVRALSAAFTAAKQFVMDSIAAYDAYVSAQVKLNAQSKLTGMSMREMNTLVDEAKARFGLGTVAAVDITAAVAKFASQAGKSADASRLMAAALELGAASGQTAAQVAEGLSSALAGNDEWLNKLGLANPSGLWKDYADANGLAVSKMSDTEKKLAVMTALIDAGSKVTGVYSDRMASAAGKQDQLNNSLDTAKVLFGAALQPIRILVIDGLTSLLNVIGPVVIALGYLASGITNAVIAPFALARSAVGSLMEAFGKLTGNKQLEAWGAKQSQVFVKFTDDVAKWLGLSNPANEAVNQQAKAHQLAAVQITASAAATEKHTKATKDAEAAHKPLYAALGMTQGAMDRLAQSAREQLPTKPAQDFNAALGTIRQNADQLLLKFPPITQHTETAAANTKDMAREVETVARGAIDAASSFGVIDDAAARSLNSAVNIASAVKNMATNGFSFAGAVGIIGGVANIVSTMMAGDTERRRLLAQNNTALDRLRKDIGGLNLRISGDTLISAQTALSSVVGNLRGGRGAANENDVRNALYAQGLSMEDFDRIAKEFGIEVRTKSGALNVDSVKAVLEAIKTVQLGKVGNDFQSQLDFFTQGQDIGNEQGAGRATNLLRFLQEKGGVGALAGLDLSNPAKLRDQLIALRGQLNSAEGIDESQLGKLSGGQFNDLLVSILGMLNTGTPSGGGDVTVPTGGGGGTTSVPSETIQSVIKAMDTNLAGILTTHTAIHERIAMATEGSYSELRTLNGKMDTLIAVSAGTDRIDAALEAERRLLAVQQGTPVAF